MFTTTLQDAFLQSITGESTTGLINPMYIGLLYNFSATPSGNYDEKTGKWINVTAVTYSFNEPHQPVGSFTGDSNYRRCYINGGTTGNANSPLGPMQLDYDPVTKTVTAFKSNTKRDILFSESTLDWPYPVTHIGVFKSADLNNQSLLMYAELTEPKEVKAECVPLFKLGAFKITTN